MKKTAKKLMLSRETVRFLVDRSLEEVQGGSLWSACYCYYTVNSNCNCENTRECW
jgi:hypothetical protein